MEVIWIIAKSQSECPAPELYGNKCGTDICVSDKIPESVTSEKGRLLQKRIWEDLANILESVEPGCVGKVL